MSSPLEVIKQYMVSLGFAVDQSSYESATNAIDKVKTGLSSFAGDTVKQFGLATASVSAFVATAVVGMAKFLGDLGNAQIQYEMLSRQLWTTQQNAEAFSTTLKAMGRTLNDLYLSPTLMAQFQQLNKQAFEMMPPAEYQAQMQFIQNITFQFTRMKLEATYALQWIGYYFIKYMAAPINNIYYYLNHINDIIIKTMPYWTKVVAEVMSWFAQFGITTVEAIKDIIQAFINIGDSIPKNVKLVGAALLALGVIFAMSPIGLFVLAFIALGLALNDFFTYIHGGQSEFGSFWQKLIDFYNHLKDTGVIDKWKKAFESAMQTISYWIGIAVQDIENFLSNTDNLKQIGAIVAGVAAAFLTFKGIQGILAGITAAQWALNLALDANPIGLIVFLVGALIADLIAMGKINVLWDLIKDFGNLFDAILNCVDAVGNWLNALFGLKSAQGPLQQLAGWINNYILQSLQTVDTLIKQITDAINAIGDLFNGNYGDMLKKLGKIFTSDTAPMAQQSYVYPSSNNHNTNNNSNVTINATNNIYGSDPTSTANQATNNINTLAIRNLKGVIA